MKAEQLHPDKSNSAVSETSPPVWHKLFDINRNETRDLKDCIEFVFMWDGKKFVKL